MYDIFLLLLTALTGLIFSYFVVTIFSVSNDDSLGRDLQQIVMQIVSNTTLTLLTPMFGIWNITIGLIGVSVQYLKWMLAFILFVMITLMMHYYHYEVLSIIDDGWKCFLIPLMNHIIQPLLQVGRVFYALSMPFINAFAVIHAQIFNAWYITFASCSHIKMFSVLTNLAQALITGTGALTRFFGYGSPISQTNNFYTNDFVIAAPLNHTMAAINVGQQVLSCACKRFEPLFNILFFLTKDPHVIAAIDNTFQFGIRISQLLFKLLFREFPDIYRVTFKLERAILETGLAADGFLFNTITNVIKLFDADFNLARYPNEGFFTIGAHLASAALHTSATLGIHGPLNLMATFKPELPALDPAVWSLQPAFASTHKAVWSTGVFVQWAVYIVERIVTNTDDLASVFASKETPLTLSCDWARDVDDSKYVSLSYTAGCSTYNYLILYVNAMAIGWGVVTELLLKSLFTQEQNVFRTLQRWEGPTVSRKKVYTCEQREAATAYNYVTGKYNENGWMWTQDLGLCNCERHYGGTRDEGVSKFNPWCGQPNLNLDIFAHLDALVMHVSHGILGPGFGDAFPFISPIRNININIEQIGMEKTIPLPIALPPITRTAIESMRVGIRFVFSFGDILTGHFFNYPVNCGHGLNKKQLVARWLRTSTDTPQVAQQLTDDVLRWTHCQNKAYKALVKPGERLKTCDSSNDDNTCMCSYTQPLTIHSGCRCIARYPDLDVTSSSQDVGDLIEERFTSESVSMHWCNSMITEWTFQNTAAFADALDYIVSLGPINPTCDVMDRLIEEKGFDTTTRDNRSSSAYLMATTPTLRLLGEFADSDTKLNQLDDSYATRDIGCSVRQNNETGEYKWACDVSGTTIKELDPDATGENSGCRIWGRKDFFCSAGLYVRNTKRATMNIARQALNDGISIIAGNYADVNLKTLPRLCDYERQQGAIAAMVAGLIPKISPELKIAFAKYLNMIIQVLNVQGIRTGLVIINIVATIVQDFVAGSLTSDNIEQTFTKGVDTIVDGYLWAFRYFWQTTGDILNSVSKNAGDICTDIVAIIDIISERLKEGLMDLVTLILQMILQGIAVMSGDTSAIDDFFINFFKVLEKVFALLIGQVWTILNEIYEFFGPIGDFMKVLTYGVCMTINAVMGAINDIAEGLSFGAGDIGWEDMTCVAPLSSGHNHTAGRLGKHFLRSHDNVHVTKRISEELDWNGTSLCDHFMQGVSEYSFTELRPLEKAQWLECLEFKMIGVEIGQFLNAKTFPSDIVYNWKRKYIMAYELARATKLALPYFFETTMNWADLRLTLYDNGIDADMYLGIFQSMFNIARQFLDKLETSGMFSFVLEQFDADYANPANPSAAAKSWRLFSNAKTVYDDSMHEWEVRDMSQEAWKAMDASYNAHTHLRRWWNELGSETPAKQTETERVFSNLKSTLKRSKRSVQKRVNHWLGTPIRTSIKSCGARGNPGWCTDCNILDNAIKTTIEQGEALGVFYGQEFPRILKNVSSYFNAMGEENFFEERLTKLTSTQAKVPKTSIRWTYHVRKDWEYLLTNFSQFVADTFNFTNITDIEKAKKLDKWLFHVDKFLNATRSLVVYTDDTYVPFFGYSLYHMYDYLFFGKCDIEESIFVTTGATQNERLIRMDLALFVCLVISVIIVKEATWSILPMMWMANLVVISIIVSLVYLWMVYGYKLNCAPLLPYMLVEDIYEWYVTRLAPDCFYKSFQYMALGPSEELCTVCSAPDAFTQQKIMANKAFSLLNSSTYNATTGKSSFNGTYYNITLGQQQKYLNCAQYVSNTTHIEGMLTLPELIEGYSIFWPGLFWVRWTFPEIGIWLVKNGIVSFDSVVGKLALDAWQGAPIDNVWIDCYYAMWLDNVVAGVVAAVFIYVVAKMAVIGVQTVLNLTLLLWYVYTSISWMSLTVENSVVLD